ncbi:MAG: hypothetical protein Q8N99_04125 [Nanoarchaeota archaeon]|nr:hypothetical protein [Nanoarchaeota archaeon]
MNKKADEKYLSIWWFLALALTGLGIVLAVVIFNSADVNTNNLEAELLNDKIAGCLTKDGNFYEKALEPGFDIYDYCKLNKNAFNLGSSFYFNITIYKEGVLLNYTLGGDRSFEADCRSTAKISAKHYPKCKSTSTGITDKDNNVYIIEILTASNQEGEKVAITR